MVHHDIWNYDNPMSPILMDVNVDGRAFQRLCRSQTELRLCVQQTDGEPLWPIEERPVLNLPYLVKNCRQRSHSQPSRAIRHTGYFD